VKGQAVSAGAKGGSWNREQAAARRITQRATQRSEGHTKEGHPYLELAGKKVIWWGLLDRFFHARKPGLKTVGTSQNWCQGCIVPYNTDRRS